METLNRKIAGMPVKVWLLVIVAAIALGLYLRRRNAASALNDQSGYETPADYYAEPISGTAGGGSGGGGVGQSAPQDLTPITDAITHLGTDVLAAVASIPVPAVAPIPAAAPPPAAPPMLAPIPPPASVGSTGPSAAPPASIPTPQPAPAGPVPGASFTWLFNAIGGLPAKSTWTMGDKSLFMQHLQKRSLSYANWRTNHASAACRVFGDCS